MLLDSELTTKPHVNKLVSTFLSSSPAETAETLCRPQCDAATRVGVHPESSRLLQLHPDRSFVVNHCPFATSAECSCPVGDGPSTM